MEETLKLLEYKQLFLKSYTEDLWTEPEEIRKKKLDSLQRLDSDEVLQGFKTLLSNLLHYKRTSLENLNNKVLERVWLLKAENTQLKTINSELKAQVQKLTHDLQAIQNDRIQVKDSEKPRNRTGRKSEDLTAACLDLRSAFNTEELVVRTKGFENPLGVRDCKKGSQIIKSVKFEFVAKSQKPSEKIVSSYKSSLSSSANSPKKCQTSHFRSSSNIV